MGGRETDDPGESSPRVARSECAFLPNLEEAGSKWMKEFKGKVLDVCLGGEGREE